jgi:hypothetical protein
MTLQETLFQTTGYRYPLDQIETAVDSFIADYVCFIEHVLTRADFRSTHSWLALRDCTAKHEIAPLPVLQKITAWVLFELKWSAEIYPLSTEQQRLQAATRRLSDCVHGTRYPWDEAVWQ